MIKELRGLRFPDDYLVKFFFKERLASVPGRVLELGCSNGTNLHLFYDHGWQVEGVDLDAEAIANANHNYSEVYPPRPSASYRFRADDMVRFMQGVNGAYDCIIVPSSIYYLTMADIVSTMEFIGQKISPGGHFYFRIRSVSDHRFGKGPLRGDQEFQLDIAETGEEGCHMTFFTESGFTRLLTDHLGIDRLTTLNVQYENLQNGKVIANSDIVFWGQVSN